MNRDMTKTVATIKGKNLIPTAYDLTYNEIQALHDKFLSDPFDAISTAFDYGFILGARAQKTGKFNAK